MALTNGSGFSISGDTATKTDASHAWCYDSDIITITQAVKYYFNDVLQYTSTNFSSGDYYPYLGARGATSESWTYERSTDSDGLYIQWTINFDAAGGGKYAGFNDAIEDIEDKISAGMHTQSPPPLFLGIWHHVREEDVAVFTVTSPPTVVTGDKFKIVYASAAADNLTYPTIPQQKSIYNQAFKS